jgi:excisionase family DNA binding protein
VSDHDLPVLRTEREAAEALRCSPKTLRAHIRSGALRYVQTGHGAKRLRRMFTDDDLKDFIDRQTRRDIPCPSTSPKARLTGTSTSSGEVIGFTALRSARAAGKPK